MDTVTDWSRLKQLAEQRRDGCAQRLADTIRHCSEAQHKLELLRQYRAEYLLRMGSASREGIHGDGLRNYRTFLGNLDRAIDQQAEFVAAAAHERVRAQAAWAAEQRSVDSYRVLQQRQEVTARGRERRDQQKQQDEFAAHALPRFITGAD